MNYYYKYSQIVYLYNNATIVLNKVLLIVMSKRVNPHRIYVTNLNSVCESAVNHSS